MGKFYKLLITQLKVSTRNKSALFFTLLFPLIFMGVFGLAFQESDPANSTIPIALINNDSGLPGDVDLDTLIGQVIDQFGISNQFIEILSDLTFEDNKTKIFEINTFDTYKSAEEKVERQTLKGLVILPQDFTLAYLAAIRSTIDNESLNWGGYPESGYSTEVEVIGDTSLIQFNIITSVISAVLDGYFSLGSSSTNAEMVIGTSITSEGFTTFDFVVPGLVIFAIISNANTVAAVALNDVESKLLDRLKLTKLPTWYYPAALVTSQIFISCLQIPLLFGTAILFGFPITPALLGAFIFAIFVSIAMSGIGLLMAGLFKDGETAGSLAAIITTPMAFFAGAFFQMPNPQILVGGILGENPLGLFDLLPPTRSITALRLIVFNNYSLLQVLPDLLITAFLAVIYLGLGIFVYGRKHLGLKL